MTWGLVAVAGATLVSGVVSSQAQGRAAKKQIRAADQGIDEQRQQFDAMQAGLAPYAKAGQPALEQQQALSGSLGPEAQQAAIQAIQNGPLYSGLVRQGEDAILQNASATGGLRGGNTQAALAQFRPNLMNSLIEQQYQRLGGLAGMGQNSATMTGQAGMMAGQQISGLYGQQGAAGAGATIGKANTFGQAVNGLAGAYGGFMGNGGFSQFGGKAPPPAGGGFGFMQTNSGIDPNAYYRGGP